MRPVFAALKKLADADFKWDSFADRRIEEWRAIKNSAQAGESSAADRIVCDFYSRPGHRVDKCWMNLANPHNRLQDLKNGGNGRAEKKFPTVNRPRRLVSLSRRAASLRASIVPPWLEETNSRLRNQKP